MPFDGSFIIGPSSIFLGIKGTKIDSIPLANPNGTSPFAISMPYALKTAAIIPISISIMAISFVCAGPQILPAIIKSIVILVVANRTIRRVKEQGMHTDSPFSSGPIRPDSVEASRTFRPSRHPVPLAKPFVIFDIYNRILALRERYQSVGLVERLDNCVSLHAIFHRSSFTRTAEVQPLF
jgi:hypothetical protein